MQFILSPLFKKMNKDIKLQYSIAAKNIREGIILLELQLLKYLNNKVTVGLFDKMNQQLDVDTTTDTVFIRPAVIVGGGKGLMAMIGALLIVVGAVISVMGAPEFGVPLIMYGVGMIMAEIFMPKPVVPGQTETDDFKDAPNYSFANFANKIGEQYPIPLIYGLSTSSGILIDYIESTKLLTDGSASKLKVQDLAYVTLHEYTETMLPSGGGINEVYNHHVYFPYVDVSGT